jgi:SET domain-containing protein
MPATIQDYHPLPDSLTVRKSPLHGLGVFATRTIPAGHDFGLTHVADERFPDGYIRTPLSGFINHSSDPNCRFIEVGNDDWKLETVRVIKPGEEVTADYIDYDEAVLATFK